MKHYSLTIESETSRRAARHPVVDPGSGEVFATAAFGDQEQVDEAIENAASAFKHWRKDESRRRRALQACARVLRDNAPELAELLTREQGKPLAQSHIEIGAMAAWFDFFAEFKTEPELLADEDQRRVSVVRRPHGVVAAITPWNYPIILLSWKLVPALLAGNTVVAKPSPFTPLTTLRIGELFAHVLPPGVFNVVAGSDETGAQLARHPGVRKIAFTGSIETGQSIMRGAADDLKPLTLELGGNDAAIVLDDAKPEQIIDALFWGSFFNSGQICCSIKRLYVHENLHDQVVRGLVERANSVRLGHGLEQDTQIGPINNLPQLEKVAALVEDARNAGARVVAGGERQGRAGYFYPPTLICDAKPGMGIVDHEQFGPALPILSYRDVDDAVEQANNTPYGLGVSVWTSDPARGESLLGELEAGIGWVNQHPDFAPYAPHGGVKHSGIGSENGRIGYEAFTTVQTVNVRK